MLQQLWFYTWIFLIKLAIRIFGIRLFLSVYNRFANDTPRPQPVVTLVPVEPSEIKLPPFYDISHWKIVTNWEEIFPHPLLMGTKATQGISYRDPTFPEYFTKMKDIVHCRRLAYHYFEKTMNPVQQADWFINYIEPYIDDDDILCLDFEQGGETAPNLWAFLDRVHQRRPNNQLMIYSRKNLMDPVVMNEAEKAYFKSIPTWPAGYPNDPSDFTSTPPGYIPDQSKWGPAWAWQYTDSGHVTGIDGDTDCNLMEPALIEWLGEEVPEPVEDVVTFPYDGTKQIVGRRFNSDFYMVLLKTHMVRFKVCHEEPFENGLMLPSEESRKQVASFAWNGDEYNKNLPLPAKPNNSAWSQGNKYKERVSAVPSLNIRADSRAEIHHARNNLEYNETSGLRYLIEGGQIKDYLYGSEDKYTEKHPRGITGLTADGQVMMLTVDGRTSKSAGITLLQAAQILKEFGCIIGYDRGGGGDAVYVMTGEIQNIPCDTSNGVPGVERAVVQTILAFAEKGAVTMANFKAVATQSAKVWDEVGGQQIATVPQGMEVFGDGEKPEGGIDWIHITSPTNKAGWSKKQWFTVTYTPPPDPEEPPVDPPVETMPAYLTAYDVNGNVLGYYDKRPT